MYRLGGVCNMRGATLSSPLRRYTTLGSPSSDLGRRDSSCLLCGSSLPHIAGHSRCESTISERDYKVKKAGKKRHKSTKKYVELLVVGDSTTMQQRAKVHHLSGDDLTQIALSSLNLSELYKLKFLSRSRDLKPMAEHTYNNLADMNDLPIEPLPTLDSDFIADFLREPVKEEYNFDAGGRPFQSEPPDIYKVEDTLAATDDLMGVDRHLDIVDQVYSSVNHCALQPAVVEEDPEEVFSAVPSTASHKSTPLLIDPADKGLLSAIAEDLDVVDATEPQTQQNLPAELSARQEIMTRTLASYAEICSTMRMPQRGLNALQFHRRRMRGRNVNFPMIENIKVYNAVLRGFAAKGDFARIEEVLRCVDEDKVKLNVQSYVAIFECLGRANVDNSHLNQVQMITDMAESQGITYHKILDKGVFLDEQRDVVFSVMQSLRPEFVPSYKPPDLQYSNKLLNDLNSNDQLTNSNSRPPKTRRPSGNRGPFTKEFLNKATAAQLDIERNVYVKVKSIETSTQNPANEEVLRFRSVLDEHKELWTTSANDAFTRDLMAMTAQRKIFNMEPYIRCIPQSEMVRIVVDEATKIAQGSETYSPNTGQLYRELGRKVYARFLVLRKQKCGVIDKITKIHSQYCAAYADGHAALSVLPTDADREFQRLNSRQRWQWAEHELRPVGASVSLDHCGWPPTVVQTVGKFLYNIVMHDIKVDVNSLGKSSKHKNFLPAFYTIFRNQGRIVKEEVKPHPILSRLYRASQPDTLTFPAYELPMRCPPVPWTSVHSGGYLVAPCEVVRLPYQALSQKERLCDASPRSLYPSLDALNQLAAVPWKVNRTILDTVLKVFRSGGSAKLDVPQPPSALDTIGENAQKAMNFRQKLQLRRKKAEMYSLWCDCLYRLSLANHFRDDVFWLPHNMDFRGRVYPVPPHLNHLGSDLARSMLVFAEPRPLGPDGLKWLKLHLINLTGLKKRDSIVDRLKFADDNMDLILDSADKPLDGKQWWVKSDEPWQTLACCMEVAAVMRSDNPENFKSHFPVHQDGSCNGLQHYAALGRDAAGGASVNLAPADRPQDVYSAVVALVEERRMSDAQNGLEIAKVLEGFVKRKVIKQTVMTTVYGVTRFGARLQITKQLKDIDDFPREHIWAASAYLTGRTFDSLRSMFSSTREIQDWFTECARLISTVCGRNVEWVTPLGLPVVQPYFRYKKLPSTFYDSFHMDKHEKPNVMKQKNAFPPNFVHSLDSSHMMLTSVHAEKAGITFVSVHDCFWTHASTVHIMNKICREQFVALHSEPILEDLSMFMAEKYSYLDSDFSGDGSVSDLNRKKLNRCILKLPKTGNFDIREVLKSTYFFS